MSTKNSSESWTVEIEEDQFGDLILPLPADMLEELDWKEGDGILLLRPRIILHWLSAQK